MIDLCFPGRGPAWLLFPCIGMIFRFGGATSSPWHSLHPVSETLRELGRSQGASWKELLMAVSSPHPTSLCLGASRWPKGDTQGSPSDNRPSDGTGYIDCGKLNSDPEDFYWLLQTEPCRDQQVSSPQAERESPGRGVGDSPRVTERARAQQWTPGKGPL